MLVTFVIFLKRWGFAGNGYEMTSKCNNFPYKRIKKDWQSNLPNDIYIFNVEIGCGLEPQLILQAQLSHNLSPQPSIFWSTQLSPPTFPPLVLGKKVNQIDDCKSYMLKKIYKIKKKFL